jgi:hypothetical protein
VPDPSFADVDRLRRACETLVRELGLALERALMAFEDPKRAAAPFLTKLAGLERDLDGLARSTPVLADYAGSLRRTTRERVEALVARAVAADRARPRVEGKLQESYNRVVGPAIANLPKQGTDALRGQVERAIRQLVDQVVTQPQVPGDVKATMTRELSRWVLEQDQVEDAFYLVQRSLSQVAGFLQEKLTIHGSLLELRDRTAARPILSTAEAHAADAQAGQLARRSVALDDAIQRQVEQAALSIQGRVRLNPRLVLDPTRRFLAQLDASAGITIKKDGVKVDLGTRVAITNPLMFNNTTQVGVTTQLGVQFRNDLSLTASHETSWQGGQFGASQFKVSLTWRF